MASQAQNQVTNTEIIKDFFWERMTIFVSWAMLLPGFRDGIGLMFVFKHLNVVQTK